VLAAVDATAGAGPLSQLLVQLPWVHSAIATLICRQHREKYRQNDAELHRGSTTLAKQKCRSARFIVNSASQRMTRHVWAVANQPCQRSCVGVVMDTRCNARAVPSFRGEQLNGIGAPIGFRRLRVAPETQ